MYVCMYIDICGYKHICGYKYIYLYTHIYTYDIYIHMFMLFTDFGKNLFMVWILTRKFLNKRL